MGMTATNANASENWLPTILHELDILLATQGKLQFAREDYDEAAATVFGVALLDFLRVHGMEVRRRLACPKCDATSEDEAGSKCIPNGDTCPGVESPLAEAWAEQPGVQGETVAGYIDRLGERIRRGMSDVRLFGATASHGKYMDDLAREAIAYAATLAPAAPGAVGPRRQHSRDARQQRVHDWCIAAFGDDHARSLEQRGIRMAEEAIEAAQASGCDRDMLHSLVNYVYARPVGELRQELGGVGVTLLALAQAAGLSADQAEADEVARVLSKPLAHFAARNAAKNAAGFEVAPQGAD